MSFYLLVKTHNTTGLKYLCKTGRTDYHKYLGSGRYWQAHLKIHGKDHTTELLRECEDNNDIKIWGKYYSELWDIVNAKDASGKKIWANLIPEEGQGMTSKTGKMIQARPEIKLKNTLGIRQFYKNNPQVKEEHRKRALEDNPMNRPGVRFKHKKSMESNVGEKNASCDLRLHRFYHESGITEYCTQNQLKKKYNLKKAGISHLVNGHKQMAYGWRLI